MPQIVYEGPDGVETESTNDDNVVKISHRQNRRVWQVFFSDGEDDISFATTIPEHRVYEVNEEVSDSDDSGSGVEIV